MEYRLKEYPAKWNEFSMYRTVAIYFWVKISRLMEYYVLKPPFKVIFFPFSDFFFHIFFFMFNNEYAMIELLILAFFITPQRVYNCKKIQLFWFEKSKCFHSSLLFFFFHPLPDENRVSLIFMTAGRCIVNVDRYALLFNLFS